MKKWLIGIVSSVIVLPIIVFSWNNIKSIWAAPDKIEKHEKAIVAQENTQEQISKLIIEQNARQDKQEAVYSAQMQSIEKQLELIAELKKRK